ncbi:MAG: hypothetical protein WAM98_18760 [Terriglobales bacterium]
MPKIHWILVRWALGGHLSIIAQTDTRRNNLFEIINTIHEQGVLVLNSNLRPEEFAVQFGKDFAWRIGKKCTVINLFVRCPLVPANRDS